MKEGIHPEYREVCFVDLSNGLKFVTRSCAQTREKIKMDDGRELPLYKLESTSESHPFYTGTQKSVDSLGGRVEKFRNKFAHLNRQEVSRSQARAERQLRLPFFAPARARAAGALCCIIRRAPPADRVNSPNPALVSQREAEPLPRLLLLLFCAAYVLPGVFGRDPWKSADITAFGYIVNIAQGKTSWFAPTVGGLPTADGALLPYWIGAVFVKALPWLDPTLAARIPFALLLALTLALTWYATYSLARSDSAQPLPFAFGGEAAPADYARAIADGALLAVIASLGLLQLGHETTPDLAQLAAVSLYLYGLAASLLATGQGRHRGRAGVADPGGERRAEHRAAARRHRHRRDTAGAPARLGPAERLHRRRRGRSPWPPRRCSAPGPTGSAPTGTAAMSSRWCARSPGSPGRPGRWCSSRCGSGGAACSTSISPCRSAAP